MATEPLYKHYAAKVVDRSHHAIVIPLDIKYHPVSSNDAAVSVMPLHIGWRFPFRLPSLVEPSVQSSLHHAAVLMAGQARNEPNERIPGDDGHNEMIERSAEGYVLPGHLVFTEYSEG